MPLTEWEGGGGGAYFQVDTVHVHAINGNIHTSASLKSASIDFSCSSIYCISNKKY